ncbi:MAG: site-2 protease family protein [Deltaproteobacteria bacterium]|jgi:Zn-dependent protease|nr:site-2 protease family protein [Deltaproteobacteria bacterium]
MNSINLAQALQHVSVSIIPILMGMILHELAHGWVAYKMGDPTAKLMGRLTLNPLSHLDPAGSMFFLLTAATSSAVGMPLILGWAKPVPINPRYFRNVRLSMILVSLAGAAANLLLAFVFAVLLFALPALDPQISKGGFLFSTCRFGLIINCSLAWFNLLPVPPLDGSKVLAGFMPTALIRPYLSLERYGMAAIVLLLVFGLVGKVVLPMSALTVQLFGSIISRFI